MKMVISKREMNYSIIIPLYAKNLLYFRVFSLVLLIIPFYFFDFIGLFIQKAALSYFSYTINLINSFVGTIIIIIYYHTKKDISCYLSCILQEVAFTFNLFVIIIYVTYIVQHHIRHGEYNSLYYFCYSFSAHTFPIIYSILDAKLTSFYPNKRYRIFVFHFTSIYGLIQGILIKSYNSAITYIFLDFHNVLGTIFAQTFYSTLILIHHQVLISIFKYLKVKRRLY